MMMGTDQDAGYVADAGNVQSWQAVLPALVASPRQLLGCVICACCGCHTLHWLSWTSGSKARCCFVEALGLQRK